MYEIHHQSATNAYGHLSTMATSLQWPLFLADSQYIDSYVNLSTTATSTQWPLSSAPKVAIVIKRFKCICPEHILLLKTLT